MGVKAWHILGIEHGRCEFLAIATGGETELSTRILNSLTDSKHDLRYRVYMIGYIEGLKMGAATMVKEGLKTWPADVKV